MYWGGLLLHEPKPKFWEGTGAPRPHKVSTHVHVMVTIRKLCMAVAQNSHSDQLSFFHLLTLWCDELLLTEFTGH